VRWLTTLTRVFRRFRLKKKMVEGKGFSRPPRAGLHLPLGRCVRVGWLNSSRLHPSPGWAIARIPLRAAGRRGLSATFSARCLGAALAPAKPVLTTREEVHI
jgi:hypothetical protein